MEDDYNHNNKNKTFSKGKKKAKSSDRGIAKPHTSIIQGYLTLPEYIVFTLSRLCFAVVSQEAEAWFHASSVSDFCLREM